MENIHYGKVGEPLFSSIKEKHADCHFAFSKENKNRLFYQLSEKYT